MMKTGKVFSLLFLPYTNDNVNLVFRQSDLLSISESEIFLNKFPIWMSFFVKMYVERRIL